MTGRARTQSESFRADLDFILCKLQCWFRFFFKGKQKKKTKTKHKNWVSKFNNKMIEFLRVKLKFVFLTYLIRFTTAKISEVVVILPL